MWNVLLKLNSDLDDVYNRVPFSEIKADLDMAAKTYYSVKKSDNIEFTDSNGNIGTRLHIGFDSNTLSDFIKYKVDQVFAEEQIYSNKCELGIADQNGNIINDLGKPLIAGEVVYSNKYQLGIADSEGNVICDLGILQQSTTPLQQSTTTINPLIGKKLSIVGDSISTYSGWIPSGYATYYPNGNLNSVEKTWWHQLITMSGMELCRNASWSGSTVSGTSNNTSAYSACGDVRINDLTNPNTQAIPDIIICYISTNDWGSGRAIGSFQSTQELPAEGAINDIAPAYALMLYKIRNKYPNAIVYCCTSLEGRSSNGDTTFPILNSKGQSIHELNHALIEVAHIFGARVIDLNVCGIHYWNIANYTTDGRLHPNYEGATLIAKYMYTQLMNDFRYIG